MDYEHFFRETLIAHAPDESTGTRLPIVGYDESANHPAVRAATSEALRIGLVDRVVDLWSQLRQRSDGSFVMLTGKPIKGALPPREEYGAPVKGYSYPDEYVVRLFVHQLIASDRAVLLSENTKRNVGGLRHVLEEQIQPAIERHHLSRFGVLAFMKRGRTHWPEYAVALLDRLRTTGVGIGFEYVEF